MAILGFDTATKILAIGLGAKGNIYEDNEMLERRHAELLFVKIDKLLKQGNVKTKDLKAVACGLGPGSFIGSRIAVTAAKTMAQVLEIPLIAAPTLDIIACSLKAENLLVATDAMRGEIFYAFYEDAKRKGEIQVAKPEKLEEVIKKKRLTVCGNAIDKFPAMFQEFEKIESAFWYPSGKNLIKLACENYRLKRFENHLKLTPIYVREVDARESYLECNR